MELDLILNRDKVVDQINDLKKKILIQGGVNQTMVSSIEHLLKDNVITKDTKITQFTQHISPINQEKVIACLESYRDTFLSPEIFNDPIYVEYKENSKILANRLHALMVGAPNQFISIVKDITVEEMESILPGYNDFFPLHESWSIGLAEKKARDVSYREYVNRLYQLLNTTPADYERVRSRLIKSYCDLLSKRKLDFSVEAIILHVDNKLDVFKKHYKYSINPMDGWNDDLLLLCYFSYDTNQNLIYGHKRTDWDKVRYVADYAKPREDFTLSDIIRFFHAHEVSKTFERKLEYVKKKDNLPEDFVRLGSDFSRDIFLNSSTNTGNDAFLDVEEVGKSCWNWKGVYCSVKVLLDLFSMHSFYNEAKKYDD